MAFTSYISKKFNAEHTRIIEKANEICEEYQQAGIPITLRSLFYQFVSRGLIDNKQTEYDRLGSICTDARLAGEMDWNYLVDITRAIRDISYWKNPQALLERATDQYHRDLWEPQRTRIEVWIEKDAGIGVISGVCEDNSVPFFSCRGYTSASALHDAALRLQRWLVAGDKVRILHIGDHDPSGLDMTRDITDRLRMFIHNDWAGLHMGSGTWTRGEIKRSLRDHMREQGTGIDDDEEPWSVKRIALNYDQIQQYNPPPNPAKTTDARYQRYVEETSLTESWELDALAPNVLIDLIQDNIDALRDDRLWDQANLVMEKEREQLRLIGVNFDSAVAHVTPKRQS